MDPITLRKDIGTHLRIPFIGPVTKVDTALEESFHWKERGKKRKRRGGGKRRRRKEGKEKLIWARGAQPDEVEIDRSRHEGS